MKVQQDRVSTGNPEADEILCGGFPANSINIVMGQPGSGKSIFAEQLVFENARGDRPILYLTTLSEPLAKMVSYLQRFAFFAEEKIGTSVVYEDIGPQLLKGGIQALVDCVAHAIETSGPKIIVIDSFKALHDLSPSALELRSVLYKLTGLLTAFRTTVFLVGEYTSEDAQRLPEFAVADGILELMRNPLSARDERFVRVALAIPLPERLARDPGAEGEARRHRDPAKERGHVREKSRVDLELPAKLVLVGVIGERIRKEIVLQDRRVVLRRELARWGLLVALGQRP